MEWTILCFTWRILQPGLFLLEAGGFQERMACVMINAFSLEGETALITCGVSGPGLGVTECFVQAGARVILVGRRSDVLQKAVKNRTVELVVKVRAKDQATWKAINLSLSS